MRLTFVILLTDSEAMQNAHQKHGQQDNTIKQKAYPDKIGPKETKKSKNRQKPEPIGQLLPVRQLLKLKQDKHLK
jgi:hypothetical protein